LAGLETVLELHSAARIGHPNARWGVVDGNPVHDPVRAIAARAGVTFNLDVTLNRSHKITNVFAGELGQSHRAGCEFARNTAMVEVAQPYDVVVTTNSGYPLDRNLYQAVKGMSAAERIVRPGGIIVMVAACIDGVPGGGAFAKVLRSARTADDLIHADGPELDRWQAQVLGRVLQRARVWLYSDGLSDEMTEEALLVPVHDLTTVVDQALARLGGAGTVAVLPEGPLTVATVVPPS